MHNHMSIWEYSFVCISYQNISEFDLKVYIGAIKGGLISLTNNLSNMTLMFYAVDPVEGEGTRWLTY